MDLTNIKTIKHLCQKYGLHPNRKNGQNFLIDKNILEKIIAAADLKPTDNVLEIGPGFGVLTQELVKHAGNVIAVEQDKRLAEFLEKEIKKEKSNLEIINDDILQIQNSKFKTQNYNSKLKTKFAVNYQLPITDYKIVSNLPYQITSPVLWKFLQEENINSLSSSPLKRGRVLESMVLMVQKEVGERICAKPGKMSILSVICQFYAECEIVSLVSRNCFWPKPEVDSAIIRLQTNNHPYTRSICHRQIFTLKGWDNNKEFMRIVKIGFSAKRKMLKNNLANGLQMPMEKIVAVLREAGLNEKIRAQELGVKEWRKIYWLLKN